MKCSGNIIHIYIRSTCFGFVLVAQSVCTDSFFTTNLVFCGLPVRRITVAVNIPA